MPSFHILGLYFLALSIAAVIIFEGLGIEKRTPAAGKALARGSY